MHQVRQTLAELGDGSRVKIKGQKFTVHVKRVMGDVICGETWNPDDRERQKEGKRWVEVTLPYSDYEHSLMNSPGFVDPDYLMDAEDVWAECEKHYGITHLGSADPDPIRRLAFALLKGDADAIMAVRSDMPSLWMSRPEAVAEVRKEIASES